MNENPYRAVRREDYVRDIPQEEYDWMDDPNDLEEEINMEPDPRYRVEFEDKEINMEPDPKYRVEFEDEEINMEPSPEYAYSYDDEEINMEPEGYDGDDDNQDYGSNTDDNFSESGVEYEDLQEIEGYDEAIGRSR